MTTEVVKSVVRRFIGEVWNSGNLDAADDLIDASYEVPGVGRGPEAVRQNIATFRAAFPDLEWVIEELIAEGDRVAVRLRLRGTHLGEFRGIAVTGRAVTMREMAFWQVRDGKLTDPVFQADGLGLRVQLGAIPSSGICAESDR
jgi:steroid delta-isomerase-like uncharacterized protein